MEVPQLLYIEKASRIRLLVVMDVFHFHFPSRFDIPSIFSYFDKLIFIFWSYLFKWRMHLHLGTDRLGLD